MEKPAETLLFLPAFSRRHHEWSRGFTLIELSIVLVIIGLIVGGVLVGQDLIKGAEVRATIAQVEKFNTAFNTFRGKYNALPGDLNAATATAFGFTPRGTVGGSGDGDGVIKGLNASNNGPCGFCEGGGETAMFWVDLTYANGLNINLIEGSFRTASPIANTASAITGTNLDLYLPVAKLGGGNRFYIWSGGPLLGFAAGESGSDGQNYFGLSSVTSISDGGSNPWALMSSPGLTVKQAAAIDAKMDDGLPQSGSVVANYLNTPGNLFSPIWAGTGNIASAPYTTATPGSATTCFDNGNVPGPQHYSLTQSGGANINCALSFRFQ